MDNTTMRNANTQLAIELLKQTVLNVLQESEEQGQPLLSPSEISKQLDITQANDNGISRAVLSLLRDEKLVECVLSSNRTKYKIRN